MLLDAQGLFSDRQAVTAPAASTNVIDKGAAGVPMHAKSPTFPHDLGKGNKVPLVAQIVESFAGTFTNLIVTLQTSAAENFAAPETLWSVTIPKASAVAGTRLAIDEIPLNATGRYLRFHYDLVDGSGDPSTASAGQITAGVVLAADEWWTV